MHSIQVVLLLETGSIIFRDIMLKGEGYFSWKSLPSSPVTLFTFCKSTLGKYSDRQPLPPVVGGRVLGLGQLPQPLGIRTGCGYLPSQPTGWIISAVLKVTALPVMYCFFGEY